MRLCKKYNHPPCTESSDSKDQPLSPMQSAQESDFLRKEWVRELPEDLDVAIAQRDFEGAVDLIVKSGLCFVTIAVFVVVVLWITLSQN